MKTNIQQTLLLTISKSKNIGIDNDSTKKKYYLCTKTRE